MGTEKKRLSAGIGNEDKKDVLPEEMVADWFSPPYLNGYKGSCSRKIAFQFFIDKALHNCYILKQSKGVQHRGKSAFLCVEAAAEQEE